MNKISKLLLGYPVILLTFISAPLVSCSRSQGSDLRNAGPIYTVAANVKTSDADDVVSASRRNAITAAVAKASPAVVGINVTEVREQRIDPFGGFLENDPMFQRMFPNLRSRTQKYEVKELGSGFIISADGYILTNDHVAGNASKVIVTLTGGVKYDAELVATDRTTDVTLLKINGEGLPYLKLGNSDDLAVGEWAIAMGNPFGLFSLNNKPTVTVGVISNTGVSLGVDEGRNYRDMIQTDAAISSGNSGGPLLNANGDVIGINATIFSTAQGYQGVGSIGLGFAIPINKVKRLIDGFKSGNKVNHNFSDIGFRVNALTDDVRDYYHIKNEDGVLITDMLRNSPADQAGLQVGDVITGVDEEAIRDPRDLESILADHVVGDVLRIKIIRNDREQTIKLKLLGKS